MCINLLEENRKERREGEEINKKLKFSLDKYVTSAMGKYLSLPLSHLADMKKCY